MSITKRAKQQGLTIVELIVALALGVVLVGGITQVYLENKRNYVQDEAMARLQENGRFAINILKRELKMTGFFGIGTDIDLLTVPSVSGGCAGSPTWALDFSTAMDFVNDSAASPGASVRGVSFGGDCVQGGNVLAGTDIISIKRVADRETIVAGVYADGLVAGDEKKKRWYLQVEIDPAIGGTIMDNDFVYIDDSGFDATILTPANNLNLWLVQNRIFYVRDYSVTAGDGIPTLVMAMLADNQFEQQPLVEGVEALHVEFGIPEANSQNGTPRRFVANPTAAELDSATVARVYLLLRSRDPVNGYTDNKTYRLGSLPEIDPADKRYMRRVFTTTVGIRNVDWLDI
ncbi:MAG TPA: PilW family protein [Pseudomonadales bacterium]